MIGRLLTYLLLGAVLVHAYFYVRYDVWKPCQAALARLIDEDDQLFRAAAQRVVGDQHARLALQNAARMMGEKRGLSFCYRVSLLGPPGRFELLGR